MNSRTIVAIALACLAPALPVAAASRPQAAAAPPASVHEAFVPDLRARDVDTMIAALVLDETQQAIVRARFEAWDAAFVAGRDETRRKMVALRPEVRADDAFRRRLDESEAEMARIVEDAQARAERASDPAERQAIMEEAQRAIGELRARLAEVGPPAASSPEVDALMARMDAIALAWMARKAELREAFLGDVRALLTPDQAARWPAFERDLRRRREIGRGRLAGEGVDLGDLLASLVPEPPEPAREALAAWEIALDAALVRRERVLTDALRGEPAAPEAIVLAHRAVRDVNLEYGRAIAAALGPDEGARFTRGLGQLAFPRAMRPVRSERLVAEALALPDLDERTRESVRGLASRHAAELSAQNEAIAQEILATEPVRLRRTLSGEAVGPAPERALMTERDAWERAILEDLREIVGPDRYDALADPPRTREARDRAALSQEQRELLRRFDANGDGELDGAEREALRAWLRQRGG